MSDEATLEITYRQPRKNGKFEVMAHFGGTLLHRVKIDVADVADRQRFAEALCELRPDLDPKEIEKTLAGIGVAPPKSDEPAAPTDPSKNYLEANGCLCRMIPTQDGPVPSPLCNFAARIVEEVVRDDGAEQSARLTVEGSLCTGEALPATEITIAAFSQSSWAIVAWGTKAIVYAGMGNADHLRVAIQVLSKRVARRTVRCFTGWCQHEGDWVYLHAGGGIGPLGPVENISIDLPPALSHYAFPSVPAGPELITAVQASLECLEGLAPDRVIFPLMSAAYRAPLGPADSSIHVAGRTGVFKTELAALAQQHWGAEMTARRLPASWSSTANANEATAFAAKDAVLVLDDFAPGGNATDIARFHRDADRVFRAQGNHSGRHRLRPDGTARLAKPPRGTIISTGEDIPKGHSLRARLLTLEIERNDVNADRLTKCQRDAAAGRYAEATAGYIRWLAPQYVAIQQELREEVARLRGECATALDPEQHRRTPSLVADLLFGFRTFLKFAQEIRAIDQAKALDLDARCHAALLEAARDQAGHQEGSDPAARYLALLGSVLSQGRAHVSGPEGEWPIESPEAWGWHRAGGSPPSFDPQGRLIGWVEDGNLYLDPDAAFAEVQRLAQEQQEPLPIGRQTLQKRLHESGLLATVDAPRKRLCVRRMIGKIRRTVLHLSAASVLCVPESGPTVPTGPMSDKQPEIGPLLWAAFPGASENRPRKPAQISRENHTNGPIWPLGPVCAAHNAPPGGSITGAEANGAPTELEETTI